MTARGLGGGRGLVCGARGAQRTIGVGRLFARILALLTLFEGVYVPERSLITSPPRPAVRQACHMSVMLDE
jgi:hypothetical protein